MTIQQKIIKAIEEEDLMTLDKIYSSEMAMVNEPVKDKFGDQLPVILALHLKKYRVVKFLFNKFVGELKRPDSAYIDIQKQLIDTDDQETLEFSYKVLHLSPTDSCMLHYSLNQRCYNSAYWLIQHRLNVNSLREKDSEGNTPLHLAAAYNWYIFAKLIRRLNKSDVYEVNNVGITPIDMAVNHYNFNVLDLLYREFKIEIDPRDYGFNAESTGEFINKLADARRKLVWTYHAPWWAKYEQTCILTDSPVTQFPCIDEDDTYMLQYAPEYYQTNEKNANMKTDYSKAYEELFDGIFRAMLHGRIKDKSLDLDYQLNMLGIIDNYTSEKSWEDTMEVIQDVLDMSVADHFEDEIVEEFQDKYGVATLIILQAYNILKRLNVPKNAIKSFLEEFINKYQAKIKFKETENYEFEFGEF